MILSQLNRLSNTNIGKQFITKEQQSSRDDKNSFEALKSIYGKFEDLTDGNIVGPLKNIKDFEDIAALLAQFESAETSSSTTTK